ncbi:MAG: putative maltokinase, partial [Chloroflexota bacterium]
NLGIRRRLAPLLNNDRRKIELLNGLLFSLPGTPVIYYGDEIGMGDNFFLGDRNGVRTPMQWNGDRNAGFSRANPQRLYSPVIMDPEYHYEAVNVEVQEQNTDSLLWWMKRLISLRKSTRAFGRGSIQFLRASNPKVLAFLRKYEDETVLVVANLSRFPQHAELDLSQFEGSSLIEMFGGMEFPQIGAQPYSMVLGRYIFYWFTIRARPADQDGQSDGVRDTRAVLQSTRSWETLFREDTPRGVPRLLAQYLPRCRWFASKGHTIRSVSLDDIIPVRTASSVVYVTLASIEYRDIESETYLIPLAFATGDVEKSVRESHPWAVIGEARINVDGEPTQGIIYDGFADPNFGNALLGSVMYRRNLGRGRGRLATSTTRMMGDMRDKLARGVQPRVLRGEQSNTSLVYDEAFILKLFRKVTRGVNPDLEIGRFLAEKTDFQNAAPVAGAIEYTTNGDGEARTVGILQGYIPNHGDAWTYTDDALGRYYEQVLAVPDHETPRAPTGPLGSLRDQEPPEIISQLVGPYLVLAQLIGKRTAEMHAALGSRPDDPEFAPQPFTRLYQRSLYQGMRNSVTNMLRGLRPRIASLPEDARADAEVIARSEGLILGRLAELTRSPISAMRIRCHGDYHLGQVLYTGGDFVIIDFEGEPARPLGERRLKRSPMRDVGGMVRSFHYAAHSAMLNRIHSWIRPETAPRVERWAQLWYRWVAEAFLEGYISSLSGSRLIPEDAEQFQTLLDMYLIDKAVYEVMYEINNRPSWSRIPLRGLAELVGAS